MYTQILVPTDGSTGTAHVAMQAFDLAEQYGAAVHLLHVLDSDVGTFLGTDTEAKTELRERGRQTIGTLEELAAGYDLETVAELREGDPSEEILAYAEAIDADLIVMGTHGRSGLERRLIGSVAERVVRRSEWPVMTVRLPETDRTVTDGTEAANVVAESFEADGYDDVEIEGADQQRNVWVVEATADGHRYTVYVDPVTRRTSTVQQSTGRVE